MAYQVEHAFKIMQKSNGGFILATLEKCNSDTAAPRWHLWAEGSADTVARAAATRAERAEAGEIQYPGKTFIGGRGEYTTAAEYKAKAKKTLKAAFTATPTTDTEIVALLPTYTTLVA